MEARLGAASAAVESVGSLLSGTAPEVPSADESVEEPELISSAAAVGEAAPPPSWPDETVESAFRAEASERGESVVTARLPAEVIEEVDAKLLPSLEELVQRIPPEVRESLEDLFRVRFVRVMRVPEKALKPGR